MHVFGAAILVLSMLATSVSAARAQVDEEDGSDPTEESGMTDADRESRIHFESGRAYYDRGDYESAAREFETGYARQPLSAFLYNLYLTYERTGDFSRAADRLEAYLDAEPELTERDTLTERLEYLRRRAAGPTETAPEPQPPPEEAAPSEAAPDVVTDPGTDVGSDYTVPAIIGFAIGGAGLVTFGIFGALALSEDSQLEEECFTLYGDGGGYCTGDDVGTAQTYALVADIGLGLGIAGVATGLILFLLSDGGSDQASARFAPSLSPTTLGMIAEVPLP